MSELNDANRTSIKSNSSLSTIIKRQILWLSIR